MDLKNTRRSQVALALQKKRKRKKKKPNIYNIDKVKSTTPLSLNIEESPIVEERKLEPLISQDPTKIGVNPALQQRDPDLDERLGKRGTMPGYISQDPTKTGIAPTQQRQPTATPQTTPDFATQFQQVGTPSEAVLQLSTQRTKLEKEIEDLSLSIANLPTATIEAKKKLGIFEDQKELDRLRANLGDVKQDLLVAQDRDIELREEGKSFVSKYAGTAGDYGQYTAEDLRRNRLDQLALSRTYSRLGGAVESFQQSINTNIGIINENARAEQAKIEFDINQKNKILDRVIQTQGNILSSQQKAQLEKAKFSNSLLLNQQKAELQAKSDLMKMAVQNGYDVSMLGLEHDATLAEIQAKVTPPSTVADVLSASPEQMASFTDGQWKAYNALSKSKTENDKVKAKKDLVNQTNSANAESVIAIVENMLSDKNREGLLNSVGEGGFGRQDWHFFGLGKDTAQFRALAKQLTSESTLKRLTTLKQAGATLGALSDNERVMLERAALGQLGAITDDGIFTGTFDMEEGDFINTLENINMANMKLYLASNASDEWGRSGLKSLEYDTPITQRADGSVVTGYDFIGELYKNAKFNILNQKPVEIMNIQGERIEQANKDINFDKLVSIESGGNYTAVNPTSGAYGKYQFIPSTLDQYAKRLGLTTKQAKTPQGQEAMFKEFTKDNVKGIKGAGYPVNTLSVYLAHQQGLGGFKQIMSRDISPTVRRNLLANLPNRYNNKSDNDVINGWFEVYTPKLV